MNVLNIAYNNYKNNIKVYSMFFISMVFSVIILSNFIILMNGSSLEYIGEINASYAKDMLLMLIIILTIFSFFFIWYASNVFLKNRKKEIGIYTFMGLDSIVVGKIYFLEMMLIGISSVGVGSCSGVFLSKFFQMIVFKVAGFNVDVKFNVTMDSILYTLIIFMTIFLFFSIKGFINILRSSVIDLLKDSKKSDNMPKITIITYIIAVFSLILIFYGYYLIANDSGKSVETLICICVGTYGLYGSIFPIILNILIKRKSFLYSSESIIMINSLAYRVKKNYRTYAVISILIACTITVLGLAVSLKKLYSTSIENSELYSISFLSKEEINNKENIEKVIEKIGDEKYKVLKAWW